MIDDQDVIIQIFDSADCSYQLIKNFCEKLNFFWYIKRENDFVTGSGKGFKPS